MGTAGIHQVAFECIYTAYKHTSHFTLACIAVHKLLSFFFFSGKAYNKSFTGEYSVHSMMLLVYHSVLQIQYLIRMHMLLDGTLIESVSPQGTSLPWTLEL